MKTRTYKATNYVIRNSAGMFLEESSTSSSNTSWTYLYNRALVFDDKTIADKSAAMINEVRRNENRIGPQCNSMSVRVCTMKTTVTIEG